MLLKRLNLLVKFLINYLLVYYPFLKTASQATFCYLPFTLQHFYDLAITTPFHWLPIASHSSLTYGSRWGGKHAKQVHLPTYHASLQPVISNSRLISKHVKIQNFSLAVKTLTKKQNVVAILINDHFNQLCKVFIKSNSLKKYILELLSQKKKKSKLLPQKIYFKISPSKNIFQKQFKTVHS